MKYSIILILSLIPLLFNLSCRGPEGPQGPQGEPGPNLAALTDPTIMPVVLTTYPPSNSEGPYADFGMSQIQIRFNKIMDRASVIRAMRIGSNRRPVYIDSNDVHSIGGDVFTFRPIDNFNMPVTLWKILERDTVTIDTTANDINGNNLSSAYIFTFMPEPKFRVVSVYPPDGATGVPADTIIRIVFNSQIGTYVGENTRMNPSIGGKWYIDDPNGNKTSIHFQPTTTFSTNTQYSVTINGLTSDLDGYQLGNNYVWSFTTGAFEVLTVSPPDGSMDVALYRPLTVFLTSQLDTATIRSSLSISPPTPGKLHFFERFTGFTFVPDPELLPDTPYTIRIDTTIRSLLGERISQPEEFNFRSDIFRVILTSPYQNQRGVTRFLFRIEVYFNSLIDTSTVRTSFNAPGIYGRFEFIENANCFYYYPINVPLPANTTFLISISRGIYSKGGVQLGEPYTFSFTTI
jgi:Bacterial Ig-like domain